MRPTTWGRQNPGGPHIGPMNLAIGGYFQNIHNGHRTACGQERDIKYVFIIPHHNEVSGGLYWIHPVCLSVCPSVCLLTFVSPL